MSQAELPVISIKPRRGWSYLGLGDLWRFKDLLYFLVWREIKGRYRQMALGPLWIILKPLIVMVVLSLVFGKLAKMPSDGLPYPVFSYAALLPWTMFTVAVSKSAQSLVSNMSIISKVYFPRLIIPVASGCAGLVDFFMSFLILMGMILAYGFWPTWRIMALPAFIVLAMAAALAIGLWLATLAVKYRDVSFAIEHLLQVAMYATPVVYPASMVPQPYRDFYLLNPMAVVIEGFRWSLLGQGQPFGWPAAVSCSLVAVLLITGAYMFRRTERNVVDLL